MAEVRFYHLTERPLESVLPVMLARSLERGWRALVRGTEPARIEALSQTLWTWREESFLAHGTPADGAPERQPIWLCCQGTNQGTDQGADASVANPNGANALFLIDSAEAGTAELASLEMAAVLFDGLDPAAVERARAQWRRVTEAGLRAVYWAQDDRGAWVKRHETG